MMPKKGRPKNSEGKNTYSEILKLSVELFAQKGFEATTVREIAHGLGITQSALYVHFKNKQEIFDVLFQEYGPDAAMGMLDALIKNSERELPPPFILKSLIEKIMEHFSQREAILLKDILIRSGKPEHLSLLKDRINSLRRRLEVLFKKWMEKGLIKNDFPIDVILWDLLAILPALRFLYQTHDASEKQLKEAKKIAMEHVDFFLARNAIEQKKTSRKEGK